MGTAAWERLHKRRGHRWSSAPISDYVDGELTPRALLRLVPALRALRQPREQSVVPGVLERLCTEAFPPLRMDGPLG